jgi:hypothetical protein
MALGLWWIKLGRSVVYRAIRFVVVPGLWWLRWSMAYGVVRFAIALVPLAGYTLYRESKQPRRDPDGSQRLGEYIAEKMASFIGLIMYTLLIFICCVIYLIYWLYFICRV